MTQIVFSDIAGTVVAGNPWDFIRKHPLYHQEQGRRELRKFLLIYIARRLRLISDTTFRHYWLHHMAASFAGTSREDLLTIYRDTVTQAMADSYQQDVIARLREHQAAGAKVILVTGMFIELAEAFAEHLGMDGAIGSRMAFRDGIVTGEIEGETCVGPRKLDYIKRYLAQVDANLSVSDCYGYADSYSDRALLGAVGQGVATYPEARMRTFALEQGWEIIPAVE